MNYNRNAFFIFSFSEIPSGIDVLKLFEAFDKTATSPKPTYDYINLVYGDYYLSEALMKIDGNEVFFW